MERNLVKGKTLGGTMRKIKRLKQYLAKSRNTIESQWTCVPNVGPFNMRESVPSMCGKRGHDEKSCPSQGPPMKKRTEKPDKKVDVCTCCNSEGHRA